MNQNQFCQEFDLLEFVRQNPLEVAPFALEFARYSAHFIGAGALRFVPNKPSNTYIVLSAGVHGNETAPMEIVNKLVSALIKDELKLKVNLLVLIGNPKAMIDQERFVDFNLNRLFCGAWEEFLEQNPESYDAKRAQFLEQQVEMFFSEAEKGCKRYHYDLHTAIKPSLHKRFAISPYQEQTDSTNQEKFIENQNRQLKFLLDCDVDTVLFYHKPSTTFSYHSSHNFKAEAFTLELGKVKPFGENDLNDFVQISETLESIICGEYEFSSDVDLTKLNRYQVKKELVRTKSTDVLGFESTVANFTAFNKGDLLLDAGAESYLVESEFESIVFPNNNVPEGQRMGLVIEKL